MISDTIIGFFNPEAEAKRVRSRMVTNIVKEQADKQKQRAYDAAAVTRRTDGWFAPGTSPNREAIYRLRTIRNRSRELDRNFNYAHAAIRVIKNNVVGTGIMPVFSGDKAGKLADAWRKWGETTECDYHRKKTFYGIQRQAMGCVVRDGEVIIRKRRDAAREIPVCLEVVEADLLDESRQLFKTDKGGWQIQGIEFNEKGIIVTYWMFQRHPMDSGELKSDPLPADEIIHVFRQDRPGQARGIPWAASAMVKMRDFDDFEDAVLMQQKIAACFAAFVKKDADPDFATSSDEASGLERLEPGTIENLKPGESVEFANPPAAQGQDGYARRVLLAIASAYGITYESLTNDLTNVNFSSGRMGWIEMQRNVTEWQTDLMIEQFCKPAFDWFLTGAELAKIVDVQNTVVTKWTPPRREMLDPVKETTGLMQMIQAGLASHPDVLRSLGHDPDRTIEEVAEWNKKLDENNLQFSSDFRQGMKGKAATK